MRIIIYYFILLIPIFAFSLENEFKIPDFNKIEREVKDLKYTYSSELTKSNNYYKLALNTKLNDSVIYRDYKLFKNPVYNFKTIDINQDGVDDFCIGLIKTTRWNSTPKPKIHIYSHKKGKIYPIWRSSLIGNNLVDFETDYSDSIPGIKILENPRADKYNIALYRWKSFGLKFVKYLYTNLDSNNAIHKLKEIK
jgi:hypothetical protein